jgi:hypothetical protein
VFTQTASAHGAPWIAREAGMRRAIVSSSTNCRDVLIAAGVLELLQVIIDGHVARVST